MYVCIYVCINTYIQVFDNIKMVMDTGWHTYIHTYIRTYVRTYIHTYTCRCLTEHRHNKLKPQSHTTTYSNAQIALFSFFLHHFFVTATLIITEGPFQVFQRFSSSKLVLKSVECCSVIMTIAVPCSHKYLKLRIQTHQ